MNLGDAKDISINGKSVDSISIDGNVVFTGGILRCRCNPYVRIGEDLVVTALLKTLESGQLINFYKIDVSDMTRTLIDSDTTDNNGVASVTYTGTGAGEIKIVATYADYESNKVSVDDYTQSLTSVGLVSSATSVDVGASVTLTATALDQHGVGVSGQSVQFKIDGTAVGDAQTTNSNGVATYTYSPASVGTGSVVASASIGNINSNNVTISIYEHVVTSVGLVSSVSTCYVGDTITLYATVLDQYGNGMSGQTVTFKHISSG